MRATTIIRHILSGRTAGKIATTATGAAASQAYAAMLLSGWSRAADVAPNMPPHRWEQSGVLRSYDACKYCGDFDSGYQHAYATAVCYSLALPQDALSGAPCALLALSAVLYGDRWLADGVILTAVLSASATPPTWAEMLANGQHSEALMAVVPNNKGIDSATTAEMAWAGTPAPAYVHLVLRLADYTTVRGAWIEGSALLDAASVDLSFSRDVAADAGGDDIARYHEANGKIAYSVAGPPVTYNNISLNYFCRAARAGYTGASDSAGYAAASINGVLNAREHVYNSLATQVRVYSAWQGSPNYTRYGFSDALYGQRQLTAPIGSLFTRLGFKQIIPPISGTGNVRLVVYAFAGHSIGTSPYYVPELVADNVTRSSDFWSGTATEYIEKVNAGVFAMVLVLSVLLDPTGLGEDYQWPISFAASGRWTLVYALHVESIYPPTAESGIDFVPGNIFLS